MAILSAASVRLGELEPSRNGSVLCMFVIRNEMYWDESLMRDRSARKAKSFARSRRGLRGKSVVHKATSFVGINPEPR